VDKPLQTYVIGTITGASVQGVPEPATIGLLAIGLGVLTYRRRPSDAVDTGHLGQRTNA
jgi:hypothetical protein